MGFNKSALIFVLSLISSSAFAGPWKVCLLKVNDTPLGNVYARTFEECERKGRLAAQEFCRAGADEVHVEGQFTVGNPQYFSFERECFQRPIREPRDP